jgi:hypothetical protein
MRKIQMLFINTLVYTSGSHRERPKQVLGNAYSWGIRTHLSARQKTQRNQSGGNTGFAKPCIADSRAMRKVDDEQDSAGLHGMFESKSQVLDTSHVPHHHEPSPVDNA